MNKTTVSSAYNNMNFEGWIANDNFCLYDYYRSFINRGHQHCEEQFDFTYFNNTVTSENIDFEEPVQGIINFGPVNRE